MANNLISTTFLFILSSIIFLAKSQPFSTSLPRSTLRPERENVRRLHFFFHDVVGGPNATAVRVAAAPITNTSPTGFGAVVIMDNLLTEGSNPNSKWVGRAQGITLSVLGRNPITSPVRELPVVGGTGVFRFASGYAEARTFFVNETNGDAIVEYNVYVLH
ncbi:hypothetical protein R6Q57_010439 [Mikania cordata]